MDPNIFNVMIDKIYYEKLNNFFLMNNNISLQILNPKKNELDILEHFILKTINYHIKNLKKDCNIDNYYIEFWTKKEIYQETNTNNFINNFHIDCDEQLKNTENKFISPLFSCVTYLDDSDFPLLLTDIDIESYKFKNFCEKNNIMLFFPKKNTQIIFDGSKFHGIVDIFNVLSKEIKKFQRKIISINVWEKNPININIYNTNKNHIYTELDTNINFENVTKKETTYSDHEFKHEFYEKMLYECNNFKLPNDIVDKVKNIYNNSNYIEIISTTTKIESDKFNKKNYIQKLIKDVNFMNKLDTNDKEKKYDKIINNRFLQRIIYNKFYTKEICEWIIDRFENYALKNGGWLTNRHKNYPTTDIPIEKIPNIFDFIIFSFKNLFQKIKKSYSIEENINFNIADLFIAKYDSETQNSLDEHRDGSFFSFNILLNEPSNFEGGGTCFEDGVTVYLEQGDIIVHSGRIKHRGNKITKGVRYILVAFISIIIDCNPDDIM
jgi:hypothetical protein